MNKILKYEIINNQKEDWVIFIHGIAGSTKTWKQQIDDFSKKYNLLLLDLPGHGNNADNIIDKVNIFKLNTGIKNTLDYLNIKSAHFVGMSLGTTVIASFAITYPEYVKSIIFGGTAIQTSGIYKTLIYLTTKVKSIFPYTKMYQFLSWFLMPKENHKKSRSIFLREAKKLDRHTMYAWIDYLKQCIHPENIIKELEKTHIGILFISGDEDHCFIKGAKKAFENIQNAQFKLMKHCGHVCSIERANEFNEYALKYLESLQTVPA